MQGVTDWDAPTPVPDWAARDVVRHLVEWFPGFIESGSDVRLRRGPSVDDDPVGAWEAQAASVQAVLDDPAAAAGTYSNPHTGELPVDQATDRFYTADVFMHTWDLARSTGQDDALDPATCAQMLAGMKPIEELIRASGQYGPAVASRTMRRRRTGCSASSAATPPGARRPADRTQPVRPDPRTRSARPGGATGPAPSKAVVERSVSYRSRAGGAVTSPP